MSSWFGGKTPVQEAIETLTSEERIDGFGPEASDEKDNLCRLIAENEKNAKDAVRVFRKQLVGKPVTVLKTLLLVDYCVSHGTRDLHVQLGTPEFMDTMVKLVQGKNASNGRIRETALGLIQKWASTFERDRSVPLFQETYQTLILQGTEFPDPATTTTMVAPTSTLVDQDEAYARELERQFREADEQERQEQAHLHRVVIPPTHGSSQSPALPPNTPPSNMMGNNLYQDMGVPSMGPRVGRPPVVYRIQRIPPGQRVEPSPEQLAKLEGDLEVVRGNVQLLSELLSHVDENAASADAPYDLISELGRTCAAMQERVIPLVDQIVHDDLVERLLKANDDLNGVLARYQAAQPLILAARQEQAQLQHQVRVEEQQRAELAALQRAQEESLRTQQEAQNEADINEYVRLQQRLHDAKQEQAGPRNPFLDHGHSTSPNPATMMGTSPKTMSSMTPMRQAQPREMALIDFGEDGGRGHASLPRGVQPISGLPATDSSTDDDTFDMFAQTRATDIREKLRANADYSAIHEVVRSDPPSPQPVRPQPVPTMAHSSINAPPRDPYLIDMRSEEDEMQTRPIVSRSHDTDAPLLDLGGSTQPQRPPLDQLVSDSPAKRTQVSTINANKKAQLERADEDLFLL